jgi:hypothetical protein
VAKTVRFGGCWRRRAGEVVASVGLVFNGWIVISVSSAKNLKISKSILIVVWKYSVVLDNNSVF